MDIQQNLIADIEQHAVKKAFKAGEVVIRESQYSGAFPILKSGTLKISKTSEDGREVLLYYLKPGESCTESFMSCIHGEPGSIKAEAEEDSEVWFLPASMAMKMIRENNQWLEYLLHSYHQRFEELLEVVEAVTFKKADERLWLLLQKKAALASSKLIHTTHEQLANELATARVVISRLLKQLEDEGKIITGRNKITLL